MISQDKIIRLYKMMRLIRQFELRLAEIYPTDVIKSPLHLSVGQEAVAVGVCDALQPDDIISTTYRSHAAYIAKGGNLKKMMAELFGKATGCAGGKAGSMHLIDMEHGILGASAVVGTTVPIAAGVALALKQEAQRTKKKRVVVSFFGDGGTEEGCFYETLNFAALKKLPILFVCENNRLAIHTPIEKRWATEKLCERVATFGIPTYKIDDQDIFTIRNTTAEALSYIKTAGPVFIECATYRWLEHVGPTDDHHVNYRDLAVYHRWKGQDQIIRLAQMLDEKICSRIDHEVELEIQSAEQFASNSPYPLPQELYAHVYAD